MTKYSIKAVEFAFQLIPETHSHSHSHISSSYIQYNTYSNSLYNKHDPNTNVAISRDSPSYVYHPHNLSQGFESTAPINSLTNLI